MKINSFEFSEGARFQPGARRDDPNLIGGHLELLRQKSDGDLTPKGVVDDARNPNSPLHSFFEWDDGEAAEQYRLQQARGLIRAVVAIYETEEEERPTIQARAYVHIPDPEMPRYIETTEALSKPNFREAVLKRALQELIGWKRRYKDLQDLAGLIEIVDQEVEKIAASLRG